MALCDPPIKKMHNTNFMFGIPETDDAQKNSVALLT